MALLKALLTTLVALSTVDAAIDDGFSKEGKDQMGPAAFMWPKDRVWSAAMDNTAPCGSVASPGNRSEFPLTNGKIALVDQDEGYNVQLGISYMDDPSKDTDFDVLISSDQFKEIEKGHTCVPVPSAPDSVTTGNKATLQIKYISDMEGNKNETYYACADILFVEFSAFDVDVPCFNSTGASDSDETSHGGDETGTDTGSDSSSDSSPSSEDKSAKESSSSLSGGAIAGIVVGSVAGIALLVGAGLVVYRRKQQRLRTLRQQHSARGVNWDENAGKGRASGSTNSVRMDTLNPGA